MAPVGRDGGQEGFGSRPRISCTQEGGPGSGESLSTLPTLYGSLSRGLSRCGGRQLDGALRRGCVGLVCSVCQALHEVCMPQTLFHRAHRALLRCCDYCPILQMGKLRPGEGSILAKATQKSRGGLGQKPAIVISPSILPRGCNLGMHFQHQRAGGPPPPFSLLLGSHPITPLPLATAFVDTRPQGVSELDSIVLLTPRQSEDGSGRHAVKVCLAFLGAHPPNSEAIKAQGPCPVPGRLTVDLGFGFGFYSQRPRGLFLGL